MKNMVNAVAKQMFQEWIFSDTNAPAQSGHSRQLPENLPCLMYFPATPKPNFPSQ
jgi:hypothetical protein